MAPGAGTAFDSFIADEISKYSEIAFPVKSSFIKRLLMKKLKCKQLHPNPEDEFSQPDVGPSYRIISEYEKKYIRNTNMGKEYFQDEDPIIVEKIYPSGYMILNGHHRWAAALRLGYSKIPVQIVNILHNQEIKEMIINSVHDKRVALDLDEIVFYNPSLDEPEDNLPFPISLFYKQRLRRGIPALFRMLEKEGYDIWVYSSEYYSMEYIKYLFKRYHVNVTSIVTGTNKLRQSRAEKQAMEAIYSAKYKHTLLIDNSMIAMIDNVKKDFRDFEIPDTSHWSTEVMDIIKEIAADESKERPGKDESVI